MKRRAPAVGAAFAILVAATASGWAGPIPEPRSYRMDDYRAPVPETLQGARVVTTEEAARLWRDKAAVFVDVLPLAPKPGKLPKGTVWRDPPRDDIPGSIWLPDTGYGALAPEMEAYFRDGLERATGGDKARPLVIYCLVDCWMSWNAAKRALGYGYAHVIWYPDGTDGWMLEDLPLERRTPEPRPSQQQD